MTDKAMLRLDLQWQAASPLHVGSGADGGLLHKYLLRDSTGLPAIPGSTVKGRLRAHTLMAYRSLGGTRHRDGLPCTCAVCLMFGSPGASPGSLFIGPLTPVDTNAGRSQGRNGEMVKTGIAIDAHRRTVLDQALVAAECSTHPTFAGQITGAVYAEEQRSAHASIGLLGLGIRLVTSLGWAKSRGLGHGRFVPALTVNGQSIADDIWRGWAEAWQR